MTSNLKNRKTLLINSDPSPDLSAEESGSGIPMAILALGSYLKKGGHQVELIDARLYKGDDIFRKIDASIGDCGIVGLSVMTAQIGNALGISEYIQARYRDKMIVWGGVHPTLFPEQTLKDPVVDLIAIGEGEATLLELVEAWDGNPDLSGFEDVKGIAFRKGGEIVINERRPLMDMDLIPPQAFELLDVEPYIRSHYPFLGIMRELLIQSSRGCPHRCAFCINYAEKSYNRWRAKSPRLVLDEVREAKERYRLTAVGFRDENFFVNRKHSKEIIDGMKGVGLKWFANVRSDYFNEQNVSDGLLRDISESGGAYLGIGAESGSDRILNMLCKDITTEQVINSASQLAKHGLAGSFSFIIGVPGETKIEMLQTVELMKLIKKLCPRAAFVGPQILRPYPGGVLYDLCVSNGYRSPRSLREWAGQGRGKFGELSIDRYPWIKDGKLVVAISTYVPAALNYDFMKDMGFKRMVYALIAKLRLALNYWRFPYEYTIAMKALKFKNTVFQFIRRLYRKGKR